MPDYQKIYDHVVEEHQNYNRAENSPGLRACIQATRQLSMLHGRSLDIGCGVGFVVQYLSSPSFRYKAWGCDISPRSIDRARSHLNGIPGSGQRLIVLDSQKLPFDSEFFSLVTSFDVLEHLDEPDVRTTLGEIDRVLRVGGMFFGSVSCRKSGSNDLHGDNLHRTVQSPDWWIELIDPDRAEYDGKRKQLTIWKQKTE